MAMPQRKLIIIACCMEKWIQIPVGTFGLSSLLARQGIEHHILHSHMQSFEQSRALIDDWIEEGFSFALVLHWKENTPTFYTFARYLKERLEDPSRLVCGGITAAYFHEEILRDPGLPDIVFRGDPEKPVLDYCRGVALEELENVAFLKEGQPVIRPISWQLDPAEFSTLEFTNYSRLHNEDRFLESINRRYFHVNVTRGCLADCEYCGGSLSANIRHSNRSKLLIRTTESAVADVQRLHARAKGRLPFVNLHMDDFWGHYFPVIEQVSRLPIAQDIQLSLGDRGIMNLERVKRHLHVFQAFRKFTFEISPESDDEEQRRLLMQGTGKEGYNEDYLVEICDFLQANGLYALVFYTLYNSKDTADTIFARLKHYEAMKQRFDPERIAIICSSFSLDTASQEYCDLPEPPALKDYGEPDEKFTRILGNLSYIRSPKDVETLLAAKFQLVFTDLKAGPAGTTWIKDLRFTREDLLSIIRQHELGKLLHQDFVRSGRYIDFILEKLAEQEPGKSAVGAVPG